MIKAIIIDDEPLARMMVKEYLTDFPDIQTVAECGDGFEGVKAIQQYQPDLVFLDIQMPKINGFEMLELVEPLPNVIFTTAFDEYAIKAFENNAVDYLLKPYSKDRFERAIEKWREQHKNKSNLAATEAMLSAVSQANPQTLRVVVKTGTRIKIIPVEDINYMEAADDFVKIYTNENNFLKNKTMSYFEQVLDKQHFVRTHRSYIVNIREITRLEPYEKENYVAILKSGAQVPVSRNGYPKLKEVLGL
jgi:two-component system, LytTR family, response regulator